MSLQTGRQPCMLRARSSSVAVHIRPFATRRPSPVHRPRATENAEAPASNNIDLETQVELFMRRQAEIESGAAFVRARDPEKIIGGDVVPDELAKAYCREVFETLKTLKQSRDMSVNEVKLIVSIEDPRAKERRAQGIEDERGVSRDEMAAVLVDIAEGRIPKDRIALKCLYEEMKEWPFLDNTEQPAASSQPSASDYAALMGEGAIAKPYIMGQEARKAVDEKPQGLADMLPDWVGYGALYGISAIPVFLAVGAVLVLFYNSLK